MSKLRKSPFKFPCQDCGKLEVGAEGEFTHGELFFCKPCTKKGVDSKFAKSLAEYDEIRWCRYYGLGTWRREIERRGASAIPPTPRFKFSANGNPPRLIRTYDNLPYQAGVEAGISNRSGD